MVITRAYSQYDSRTFDANMQLCDAQTVTAGGGALTLASAARVLNLGVGHMEADAVFDIGTVKVSANDEQYLLVIQGSNTADMSTGCVALGAQIFGALEVTGSTADEIGDVRIVIPFENAKKGTLYQYIRAFIWSVGTSESIAVVLGFVAPRPPS